MHILVVTAVPAERDAVTAATAGRPERIPVPGGFELHRAGQHESPAGPYVLDAVAAGVGPAAAAAGTATALTAAALGGRSYDLVVSAGIGGGFQPAAPVGALVVADEIAAADLGAESPDGFLPVTALGFGTDTHRPPEDLVAAVAAATGALPGTVLTGSTVTGSTARAQELAARHPRALAEAMEGFGVAEAAAAHGVPVLELRTISNPVGPRDRAAWRIGEALAALTAAFADLPRALSARSTP
ncbi:futalosine hydrolase [Streptomyces purpurogeneiscleroticus]|uniref:futalosine hydrolase n=1 Tax=Streptomyces purpurogeneiscleroticus TaxID=68259 RepID=UPI001CBD868F|nr:futalosine hydrolase [Streptomyces purpurogeneiscleroticus]MBZ4016306.1 futalosine hydrolase [Streptomyces purpurogeneiscleroticus]